MARITKDNGLVIRVLALLLLLALAACQSGAISTPPRNGGTAAFAARFAVPILMLAGGEDQYHSCCLIETARTIETLARERGAVFELIVYPKAGHGFNLPTGYRMADADDAWRRTLAMLQTHFRE